MVPSNQVYIICPHCGKIFRQTLSLSESLGNRPISKRIPPHHRRFVNSKGKHKKTSCVSHKKVITATDSQT